MKPVPARREGESKRAHYLRIYRDLGLRGVMRRMFTPPRRLRLTKAGWIFFGFLFLTVVFAYSTDNNLLFLLFSALLASMVASGFMSEASLGPISVKRRLPPEISAGVHFPVHYYFTNNSKRWSAYAFQVEDVYLYKNSLGPMVISLKSGQNKDGSGQAVLFGRGYRSIPDYRLFTRYPFLLFTKSRVLAGGEKVLVLPRSDRAVKLPWLSGYSRQEGSERASSGGQGEGDSVSFVREKREGEAMRRVDWRKSARYEKLFIKEFERQPMRKATLIFDPGNTSDIEEGIEICASLAAVLNRQGLPFALVAGSGFIAHNHGGAHLRKILKELALFEKGSPSVPAADLGWRIRVYGDGKYTIG